MLLFSTHLLDELAGLDEANPATCPECAENPAFLAENTGFITVLDEDHPAQYGATLGYGIPTGANTTEASMFIEYLLSEGYLDTLGMATEGRIPLRNGTAENPTEFLDAWAELGMGADKSISPAEVYGADFVGSLAEGMNAVHVWAAGTPDALLVGSVSSQGTLAGFLERLYAGEDPAAVTAAMKQAVEEVQASL
jgi:multiple sugar transport system substrate-binding protein